MGLFDVRDFEKDSDRWEPEEQAEERRAAFRELGVDVESHMASTLRFSPWDHCFECGEPLGDDVLVYWMGSDPNREMLQLWMHIPCARHVAQALLEDVRRAEEAASNKGEKDEGD